MATQAINSPRNHTLLRSNAVKAIPTQEGRDYFFQDATPETSMPCAAGRW